MKACYNSKCPNISYTADISRQKCFNSFCESYILSVLGYFNIENNT